VVRGVFAREREKRVSENKGGRREKSLPRRSLVTTFGEFGSICRR